MEGIKHNHIKVVHTNLGEHCYLRLDVSTMVENTLVILQLLFISATDNILNYSFLSFSFR